jgi:membrane protein implicated in regulation of membrane protease activity
MTVNGYKFEKLDFNIIASILLLVCWGLIMICLEALVYSCPPQYSLLIALIVWAVSYFVGWQFRNFVDWIYNDTKNVVIGQAEEEEIA